MLDEYRIQLQAGKSDYKQYAIPNKFGLSINEYTHFQLNICDKTLRKNYNAKELKDIVGIDLSKYGEYFFNLVPKKEIEKIINILFITDKTTPKDYGAMPCEKCGLIDTYNGPSTKHNGSIRCYQHC